MRRLLVVFPTLWDARQLESCRPAWSQHFEIAWSEPRDEDCRADFDAVAFVARTAEENRGRVAGILSSSDYPGATVAAAIARRLGLPGPDPRSVIRCSHKYYSRLAQREAVPEATAGFHLVDPAQPDLGAPDLSFPCFVKPVKGAFSIMSGRVDSRAELEAFLARPAARAFLDEYVALFDRLVGWLTDFEIGGRCFLAEELLHGAQTTVEGFARDGSVEILGIVDSVLHPGSGSFARFDYPSGLRPEIQRRMEQIARRAILGLGLENSLFNIEMIYEAVRDRIHIIEINPRLCGQFGDLYAKVDGVNSYEVALALAAGDPPELPRGQGRYRAATSFPLRVFEPVQVARAPSAADVSAAEALYPETLVWPECQTGESLIDFEAEDGHSSRYAVVNLGADDRQGLLERLDAVVGRLGFDLRRSSVPDPLR
jgi:biotin carboxylase